MDVESSRATTAPAREEHISRAGEGARRQTQGLLRGSEGSRLSRGEDHIPDRVVARDAVAIAPTADLVVPEDVSSSMAFRAGVGAVVWTTRQSSDAACGWREAFGPVENT